MSELGYYFGAGVRIYFSYVMNMGITAYASCNRPGDYYIGISVANLIRFTYAFTHLLAMPNVLTSIGDPTKGTGSAFNLRAMLWGSFDQSDVALNDPTRSLAASLMVRFVMDIAFAHELSHILEGHIDYGATKGHARFHEHGDVVRWTEHDLIRAMEDLADRQSSLLVSYFPGRGIANRTLLSFKIPDGLSDEEIWTVWSFAITVFFLSLEESPSLGSDRVRQHSHPELRVLSVLTHAKDNIRQHAPSLMSACEKGIQTGFSGASSALRSVGLEHAMENYRDNREALNTRWKELTAISNSDRFRALRERSLWKFFRFPK